MRLRVFRSTGRPRELAAREPPRDGFDDTAFIPWLMVPSFGLPKSLRLRNAEGMTVTTDNAGVARLLSPLICFALPGCYGPVLALQVGCVSMPSAGTGNARSSSRPRGCPVHHCGAST